MIPPAPRDWKDLADEAEPIDVATEPAPRAKASYLRELERLVRAAATTPYVPTSLHFDASNAADAGAWHVAQRVNDATHSLRPYVTRASDAFEGAALATLEVTSSSSGATANDVIEIDRESPRGSEGYPPTAATATWVGSEVSDYSPSAPMDRLCEATTQLSGPYTERFTVSHGCAFLARPRLVGDLEDV